MFMARLFMAMPPQPVAKHLSFGAEHFLRLMILIKLLPGVGKGMIASQSKLTRVGMTIKKRRTKDLF